MSQAHPQEEAHEGPIKTPKQLVVAVIFAFLVPIVLIVLLVTFVSSSDRRGEGSDGFSEEAVAERIQPVGAIEIVDASAPKALSNGEQVYTAQCAACHATGAAGAPKFGDAAAWGPRLGQGLDALVNSALKGKGAMPPQGGGQFSDYEIARAVVYMANQAGGKFEEPAAPAGAAASAADAGAAVAAPATA
ncbi:MAG: c-type cytochrome, partial [Aquabacterium sp.]|nr:c-type cytochrome [Aquabacterium sp.]